MSPLTRGVMLIVKPGLCTDTNCRGRRRRCDRTLRLYGNLSAVGEADLLVVQRQKCREAIVRLPFVCKVLQNGFAAAPCHV